MAGEGGGSIIREAKYGGGKRQAVSDSGSDGASVSAATGPTTGGDSASCWDV